MPTLTSTVHIDAPTAHVWEILADFGAVYRFNPSVRSSHSTSEASTGTGATRHCDLAPMGSVEERIIDWNEGTSCTIEIFESSRLPSFTRSIAHMVVMPEGDGCRFTGTLDYELRFGLIDRLGAQRTFGKAWKRFAAGLKAYAESGEEIDHPKDVTTEDVQLAFS